MLKVTEIAFSCYPSPTWRAPAGFTKGCWDLKPMMVVGETGGNGRNMTSARARSPSAPARRLGSPGRTGATSVWKWMTSTPPSHLRANKGPIRDGTFPAPSAAWRSFRSRRQHDLYSQTQLWSLNPWPCSTKPRLLKSTAPMPYRRTRDRHGALSVNTASTCR